MKIYGDLTLNIQLARTVALGVFSAPAGEAPSERIFSVASPNYRKRPSKNVTEVRCSHHIHQEQTQGSIMIVKVPVPVRGWQYLGTKF